MATLTLTQEIDRPVADVFETVADIGNFASWNPTIKSSRQLTSGEPGIGTRAEWQLKELLRLIRVPPGSVGRTSGQERSRTDPPPTRS